MSGFPPETDKFINLIGHGDRTAAEEWLREHPEMVTQRNGSHETALHWLAIEDCTFGVQLLARYGADVNAPTDYGETPLMSAAQLGYVDLVRWLIEQGAQVDARESVGGGTALHAAAGHSPAPEIIDLLVTHGADVNARDDLGETPLHGAVSLANATAVVRLLALGADVHARNGNGSTPALALSKDTPVAILDALAKGGARLDDVDSLGRTLLHAAVFHGSVSLMRFLLDRGLDPLARDEEGQTPADAAIRGGHPEVVELLQRRNS